MNRLRNALFVQMFVQYIFITITRTYFIEARPFGYSYRNLVLAVLAKIVLVYLIIWEIKYFFQHNFGHCYYLEAVRITTVCTWHNTTIILLNLLQLQEKLVGNLTIMLNVVVRLESFGNYTYHL